MKNIKTISLLIWMLLCTSVNFAQGWQKEIDLSRLLNRPNRSNYNTNNTLSVINDNSIVVSNAYKQVMSSWCYGIFGPAISPDSASFIFYNSVGIPIRDKYIGSINTGYTQSVKLFQIPSINDYFIHLYKGMNCNDDLERCITCSENKSYLFRLDTSFSIVKNTAEISIPTYIFSITTSNTRIMHFTSSYTYSLNQEKVYYLSKFKIFDTSLVLVDSIVRIDTLEAQYNRFNLLDAILLPDNSIVAAFNSTRDTNIGYYGRIELYKYTPNGAISWVQNTDYDSATPSIIKYINGYIYIFYKTILNTKILKYDINGNLADSVLLSSNYEITGINILSDDIQIIGEKQPYNLSLNNNWSSIIYFINSNTLQLEKTILNPIKKIGDYGLSSGLSFTPTKDSGMISLKSFINKQGNSINVLVKLDKDGNTFTTKINGNVYGDKNINCNIDSTDFQLRNNTVIINGNNNYYLTTDSIGNYEQYVDSGSYNVHLIKNASYTLWDTSACTSVQNVQLNLNDSAEINFGLKSLVNCPSLEVFITTPILKRCFDTKYYVQYCNNGTENASNAYIDVSLDPYLTIQSSQLPYTALGNNVFRFPIGNINVNECGLFDITVLVSCDSSIAGQTHCTEAHIYPDTVCLPTPYNGAYIVASAQCLGDSVAFKLRNTGNDMTQMRRYIVTQDVVIRMANPYQLNSGQELIIKIPVNNASTFRIEAEQDINFPALLGDPYTAAFIQNCNINNRFDTGFIPLFPMYDGEPFRDVDCQQNRSSADPNDKIAQPIGIDTAHFIPKNTDITYTVRFQNTGNAPAHFVTIIDTISNKLNIQSLILGTASHPYIFSQVDSNVIRFDFNNINLPDSATNQSGSHGFVQFTLKQQPNLPIGTVINNTANIYFDYNYPISTNTTWHTIGENYLRIDLISSVINKNFNIKEIKVYPNPFVISTQIIMDGELIKNAELTITDITGKQVFTQATNNNIFVIQKGELPSGLYLYNIRAEKELISTGKIIAQ